MVQHAKRLLSALGVLLVCIGGAATAASAQGSSDVYTVTGVSVDATGADAEQARSVALADARIKASDEVLRRFTLYEDWPRLPELDAQTAELLVAGIGVANERASATRYIADVTARLNPQAVRDHLRRTGVRFTENQAAPSLLLPVLDTPGVRVLFDEPNPWRAAWEQTGLANSLVPISLPLGDLQDFSAIDAGSAITADWPAVAQIAARYNVEQVLVAHARGDETGQLEVTLHRVTPTGSESTVRTFSGATVEEAAAAGAEGIRNSLIASWKTQNAVAFGLEQIVSASVEFTSLAEWAAIRSRLNAASIVQGLDVVAMSPRGAQINLRVAGPMPALAANLSQRQIRLVEEAGFWTITVATAMTTPQADVRPDAAAPVSGGNANTAPVPRPSPAAGGDLPADEATADRLTRQNIGSQAP
ncbi:DUF2066 domain-containing protein [Pyruvatibacter sp.]|uniref:DUF2066 domain-containing protein n=1 Tax=Pyruvatibacter sp. TaxID=1981328 RepID=UPI0032EBE67D